MTARANQLFQLLQRQQVVGVVTPTALNEVLHVLIRLKFEAEVARRQPQLQRRFPGKRVFTWSDVYKLRPYLLQRYAGDLDQVVQRMHGQNLLTLQPSDLGPIPGNRGHEREMLRLIRRYALDTNDVSILLEASRAGLTSIASLDADLRRARQDFDVYTWL
jgi:predicted nucleic acid-binding protein